MSDAETTAQWLDRPDGKRVAYNRTEGTGPGVIFLGGYASDMTGSKATFLEGWARERGRAFVRFDYLGHGISDGDFLDGTLGRWLEDATAVLDRLTDGPQILVGSSMGGWIMLRLALARPERIAGLVGIAAAPDFSQSIWWDLDEDQRAKLVAEGSMTMAEGDDSLPVSHAFVAEGHDHLVMRGRIAIDVPVRLLQGMKDEAVPWRRAQEIADLLTTEDVVVTLVKDGDHRLSRDEDLARLGATLDELCARV